MTAITQGTDYFVKEALPNPGIKMVIIQCKDTVDASDTLTVSLTKYGIASNGLIGVIGFEHSTANSVVIQRQPTTAVASGILTVTLTETSNLAKHLLLFGSSLANP